MKRYDDHIRVKESSPQLGDRHNFYLSFSLWLAHYNGVGNELSGRHHDRYIKYPGNFSTRLTSALSVNSKQTSAVSVAPKYPAKVYNSSPEINKSLTIVSARN